jgi:hypothetical protein
VHRNGPLARLMDMLFRRHLLPARLLAAFLLLHLQACRAEDAADNDQVKPSILDNLGRSIGLSRLQGLQLIRSFCPVLCNAAVQHRTTGRSRAQPIIHRTTSSMLEPCTALSALME